MIAHVCSYNSSSQPSKTWNQLELQAFRWLHLTSSGFTSLPVAQPHFQWLHLTSSGSTSLPKVHNRSWQHNSYPSPLNYTSTWPGTSLPAVSSTRTCTHIHTLSYPVSFTSNPYHFLQVSYNYLILPSYSQLDLPFTNNRHSTTLSCGLEEPAQACLAVFKSQQTLFCSLKSLPNLNSNILTFHNSKYHTEKPSTRPARGWCNKAVLSCMTKID